MDTLADQLNKVKLKTVDKERDVKDYSHPKLQGFTSDKEIADYQQAVLDVNTETWVDLLQEYTFPSLYCPISFNHAELFIKIYETNFKDRDPELYSSINWKAKLSTNDKADLHFIMTALQDVMDTYLQDNHYVFVKTSSRSAKDAPMYNSKFHDLYSNELKMLEDLERKQENAQITCLLKAAFQAMKMNSAKEVIDMFVTSERIYQDMLLAVEQKHRFHENFIVRKFQEIDVDLEFRGFVYSHVLTALSQYNYLIYSQRLTQKKECFANMICHYFSTSIAPKLRNEKFVESYIIDFAISTPKSGKEEICVIEINPFLETTDGALFSWQHERHILEGREGFQFRVTERPKPGAKAMLPFSVRKLLEQYSKAN